MRLTQRDHAQILARLDRIEAERLAILDILLPPDDEELAARAQDGLEGADSACPHPSDAIEDRSTLGDERYHCTTCGADFDRHPRQLNPEE